MHPHKILAFFLLFVASVVSAHAHPGHGSGGADPNGVFHYLSSLGHLIPLLTVIGIILFAILKKKTEAKRVIRK